MYTDINAFYNMYLSIEKMKLNFYLWTSEQVENIIKQNICFLSIMTMSSLLVCLVVFAF